MKNKIIVVNPVSTNIMKAICNSLIANLVDIIIIGNREKIKKLCDRVNINICILRIIHCNNEKEIVFKLKQYQEKAKVDGIIIDELKEYKYKELLNCDYYSYLKTGSPRFRGEYMIQYSWAETTSANLSQI